MFHGKSGLRHGSLWGTSNFTRSLTLWNANCDCGADRYVRSLMSLDRRLALRGLLRTIRLLLLLLVWGGGEAGFLNIVFGDTTI